MKNALLFTYNTNILVRLLILNINKKLSYPKNQKMCNTILATLLKMRPLQWWEFDPIQRHFPISLL